MKPHLISALGLLAIASMARAAGPADLIRLYEEEVLAHNLYVALGKKFPEVMPLQNIPRSEAMHRDALAAVLKADGIELPKPPKGRRFVSKGLDKTFAKWLAEGKKSAADACRVGVRLEDHDIADLRKAQVGFPAHKEVLGQLESASYNHLRAFNRNLTARGGEYTPEAISAPDFKAIVNGAGNGGGGCGAGGCDAACEPSGGGPGKSAGGTGAGNGQGGPGNGGMGKGRGNGNGWHGGR